MNRAREAIASRAADPGEALVRLDRIAESAAAADLDLDRASDDALEVLALACHGAPYAAQLIARDPTRLLAAAADPYLRREKPARVIAAEVNQAMAAPPGHITEEALFCRLREVRAREIIRLAARQLGLGTGAEVARELSHLADAALETALSHLGHILARDCGTPRTDDGHEPVLCVMGMGKLGGEELNFASDIDLIYVYSTDDGAAGRLTLHQYFSRLCTRLCAAIGEVTAAGLVFRVDMRLRPEGQKGPIACSLASLERYYETWGRAWERQAWLKARPCAGSRELGAEILATLEPFIYPRSMSSAVITDVTSRTRDIQAEARVSPIDGGFDIKTGAGGIREIEFFVQALQMIHAGARPAVRSRNTARALDKLLFAGLITEAEHRTLTTAYWFLRHTEHVIQLDAGRQTQRLPTDPRALAALAGRLEFATTAAFEAALFAHTAQVAEIFATLSDEEPETPAEILALASGNLPPERERAILETLGFADPEAAHHMLVRARARPLSPFGAQRSGAAARIAPALLTELVRSPDPDLALATVLDLISRRRTDSAVWQLLDESRPLLRLMVSLFGTSVYLSKAFVAHPELIDVLVGLGGDRPRRDSASITAEIKRRAADRSDDDDDEEARWDAVAEIKTAHVLRIGLADIAGELSAAQVCGELSALADACLGEAYDLSAAAIAHRHGRAMDTATGHEAKIAIFALGKLGGRELGYASDLDLIFIYAGDGHSDGPRPLDNLTYMTRLAQRLMSGLRALRPAGRLYEVDTRLRPSGSQGLLVTSVAAWERYHRGEARLWERQALTKLRPVAGDPGLCARVFRAATHYVYGTPPGAGDRLAVPEIARAIRAMRERIERELVATGGGQIGGYDIKIGPGGLIDIEFAAQLMKLCHGHAHPALRQTSTTRALAEAARVGVLDGDIAALLVDGYWFLRRIEHRMRIVHDQPVHRLPAGGPELSKLARRLGYAQGAELRGAFAQISRDIRAACEAIFDIA